MSTLLGNNTKPTSTEEWSGINTHTQVAHVLTLPAGGPWNIVKLGAWMAGKDAAVNAYLCIWNGAGTLLGQTANFSATGHAFAVGNCDSYEWNVTSPPSVAGGTSVYVGWSRDPAGKAQWGRYATPGSHIDGTVTNYPGSIAANDVDTGGDISAWLYYSASNTAPTAPTLNSPISGALVASRTPTLNFTHHDPDTDASDKYTYQVDNNSDFSSPTESVEVVFAIADGASRNQVVSTSLTRGTTYYWRVKTSDALNGYGPYSAGESFKIAVLPTATVTAPASAQTAELYYTAGSGLNPKIMARWNYACTDGHAQASAIIKIYADSGGSPGSLLNTDNYTGSNAYYQTTYVAVENTKYHVSVQPTCTLVQGNESSKNICRARWGRASYYFDGTSSPSTLAVDSNTTVSGTQSVVLEYATSASAASEPTTWYSSIGAAGLNRYFWHRATMFAWGSATPSSPKLNSLTWTYGGTTLVLDKWTAAAGSTVDVGIFAYGTQSLKHATNGASQKTYQAVSVTAQTSIVMSGRVLTSGQPNAELRIEDDAGTVLASVVIPASNGAMTRYNTAVVDTGGATSVRAVCYTNAAASNTAWFDAIKIEASTVVTPWTPGFVSGAVSVDSGGFQVNAQTGVDGVFRAKGTTYGSDSRAKIELGTKGWTFGGDTEISSPAAGELKLLPTTAQDKTLTVETAAAKLAAIKVQVTGDSQPRATLRGDATVAGLLLGSGSATDVRAYRSAAKVLTLDDNAGAALTKVALVGATALEFGGDVSLSRTGANDLALATGDRFKYDPPGCLARRTTLLTLTTSTWTAIPMNASEDFDPFAFHSTSTNPSRFTVPTGWTGTYTLTGHAQFDASAAGNRRLFGWGLNGASPPSTEHVTYAPNASSWTMAVTTVMELAAGDYVELMAWQDSGGNLDIAADSYASILYVGERV